MCRKPFRLLIAVFLAGLLLALALGSLTAPARSQGNRPAPAAPRPNPRLDAARHGRWPAQLAAHSGAVRPDRHGPQRNDPAEGIPQHAYSPFDERVNRDHPCPPGGCEFEKGHLIVKLAPEVRLRGPNLQGAWTEDATLNKTLAAQGVVRLEPIFAGARPPKRGEFVVSPQGERLPKPDLTRWYRAILRNAKADVYATVQALSETPGIAWAEPDYLRRLAEGPKSRGAREQRDSNPKSEIRNPKLHSTSAPLHPSSPAQFTDPLYPQQWHLTAVNAPQAWDYLQSQGLPPGGSRDIVVAVIDTGVDYTHPDLAANMWTNSLEVAGNGVDDDGNGFVDDVHGANVVSNQHSGNPMDDHGHGTHVAGIIAAQANNGAGGVGVAYNVQLMAIKAAQYSGVLASSDIAEAIAYAVAQGADVINMSFGGYARSQLEEDALAVAFGQAVLVAAAGNDGKVNLPCKYGRDMYPAAYNWVLGVMARAQYPNAKGDYLAGFSNFDCKAQDSHEYELMSPGVDVWSTLPSENYAAWDGTSMATPVVAGIAALVRTAFPDKDVYSSRFIMGQIATTGGTMQAYTPIKGPAVSYYVPDAYAALTTFPKPKLSYLEHWLFDTAAQDPNNDDDGIVDAGETIDLAIVIRNHWGKADPVTVTLEAWAEGAYQPDPYVTMITGTVNYGAVGSFNIDDNGLIYDNDVILGVRHPFRFTVDPNTPNDHLIPFRLTMTAGNGFAPGDPPLIFTSYFYLIVQRGRELPRIISQDMVLSKDYYWLVPDQTLIEAGVTVTVTEGTQVQFWSTDPDDPYSQDADPYLQVEGEFLVRGTISEPVEFFSGAFYPGHKVDIRGGGSAMPGEAGTGVVDLEYVHVLNPRVNATRIDHSYFAQELFDCIYYRDEWGTNCQGPSVYAATIANSILYKLGREWDKLSVSNGNGNLYDSDVMYLGGNAIQDSVFLKNYKLYETQWGDRQYWVSEANGPGYGLYEPAFLRAAFPVQHNGKTYVVLAKPWGVDGQTYLDVAESFANQLGGHVVTINDAAENEFLRAYVENNFRETVFNQIYPDMDCGDANCWELFQYNFLIGLTDRETEGQFEWISGEPVSYTNWLVDDSNNEPDNGDCPTCDEDFVTMQYWDGRWRDVSYMDGPVILELPGTVTHTTELSTTIASVAVETSNVLMLEVSKASEVTNTIPFLDLPITYTNFAEALQGNVNGTGPGLVNAWLDHNSPDYTTDGQVTLWTGASYTSTATTARSTCTTGAGCYDGYNGIDFKGRIDSEMVFAAAPGTVISTTTDCQSGTSCGMRYGNQVWIDHGNNYATLYGHLEAVSVTIGTAITDTALQPLGIMGHSGDSRGTQLHFGVYYDQNSDSEWAENEVVDPFGWVGKKTDPWNMPNDYLWTHPISTHVTVSPTLETTLTSASGHISVTIPSGAFTSTVDLEMWETPPAADPTSHTEEWWGRNARSLGRSFLLYPVGGESTLQNSIHLEITYAPTQTRHLQENQLRLLHFDESTNTWTNIWGTVDTTQHRFTTDYWGNDLGHFDLQAPLLCGEDNRLEPNDSYYAAVAVPTDNSPLHNLFDIENDEDWFQFEAVAGETYVIQTSELQGSADTLLEIYDRDGTTVLATDDNSGTGDASLLRWQAPGDGTYFIRVIPAPGSPYGCQNWPYAEYKLKVYSMQTETLAAMAAVRDQFIAEGPFNNFINNAFLNVWWDPNIDHWMRFNAGGGRGYKTYLTDNYWGTTNTTLIDKAIEDYNDDFNKGLYVYQPILTAPVTTTYPFVTDVILSTAGDPDAAIVGAETVTFTVTFNRDMSTTIQPAVSFGPDVPETDYTIHSIAGGWQDPRTWVGSFNITPITGDGYQFMRIAGAVAADDPWLVTGDDAERFRFEIVTSGTEAMNLQATGGEGYVDLSWTQDDFDLLAGFNLYRSTSITGTYTLINDGIIPPEQRTYRDSDVQPGQPYYYKFTVVKTDMSESDFSNVAMATPVDTVAPTITHTPVTEAAPGLPLTLSADVTDNVVVQDVILHYRAIGAANYQSKVMVNTTGSRYTATIAGSEVASPGLEYYIEATDGVSTVRKGRAEYPYQVTVVDKPVVTAVSPNQGPASGGTNVTIAGSNFKDGASVTFDGAVAEDATILSSNQITATTPAHFPAAVDVTVTNPDSQSSTLLRGFTYESDVASLSLPDTGGGQHDVVQVPIHAASIQGLAAADLTVTFDSNVLNAQGAGTGNLTPGWSLAANTDTAGQIRLSMASPGGTVSGSGVLANLQFEVIGSPGNTSTLHFATISLNDGAIATETADGSFSVDLVYDVAGTVHFWNGGVVPDTLLSLQGDRVYTDLSDNSGAYTVSGAESGDYTLTPSKPDDVNGISAYDASLALQHAAGLSTLSGYAATAGDVNKSGAITSMDAFYILQKAVDLITLPFPGAGVVWDFDPPSRNYTNLNADQSGQDFTAVLLGDASGNWAAGGGQTQVLARVADTASLALPDLYAEPGERITVTLSITLEQAQLYAADLIITYNPAVLTAVAVATGETAQDFLVSSNLGQSGTVRVALAGSQPLTGAGVLLHLAFDVVGQLGDTTALAIAGASLNEDAITAQPADGVIQVVDLPACDFDRDCRVAMSDVMRVVTHWRTRSGDAAYNALYDRDEDGDIDIIDIMTVSKAWGEQCPP